MALGAYSFGKGFRVGGAACCRSEDEQPLEEVIRVILS